VNAELWLWLWLWLWLRLACERRHHRHFRVVQLSSPRHVLR
jgi:hypothetical protein